MREFQKNILLSQFSSYKIGGRARYFFDAKSVEEMRGALQEARRRRLKIFVLGGGTNVLVSDGGFDGLVLRPLLTSLKLEGGVKIRAGAGVPTARLVRFAARNGLSGMEWAGGLPGTVGGAIRGNAGAFGGEMKDAVESVTSINIATGREIVRSKKECRFAYRSSIFKESGGKEIVLAATLRFKKGAPRKIAAEAREHIKYRRLRQPPYPNIGSIFENVPLAQIRADKGNLVKWVDVDSVSVRRHGDKDRRRLFVFPVKRDPFPVVPAARLIAEAGLKGEKCGGAMISPKHPNFIVNIGGAKAADVKCLIARAKKGVRRKFNVRLEEEVQMV